MSVIRRDPMALEAARHARLEAQRLQYVAQLNAGIARIRQRYITALPGQDMIYQAKEEEARGYLQLEQEPEALDDFPFIAAEVGTLAETPYQVAQIWLNMAAHWRQVAAELESLRMGVGQSLSLAQSQVEMEQILDQFRNHVEPWIVTNSFNAQTETGLDE